LIPTITGRAFVNGEATILIREEDPFAWGIPVGKELEEKD
jgi:proline racemase